MSARGHAEREPLGESPTVTIVFLVYNRCEELRTSLVEMLEHSDYDPSLVDVIVVDNASKDGASDMVEAEFPQVQLIRREVNCGVSAWNDGFAVATGELILVLDDDCYLPPDGLTRAVEALRGHDADLASFAVTSAHRPGYRFDIAYRTGLLSFWGCSVLIRRDVIEAIGGFDREIFVWAHELEFMLRFFDRGFRHLHMPEVVAIHMKDASGTWRDYFSTQAYRINSRHFGYVAAKHLHPRDALETLVALLAVNLRDGVRHDRTALGALVDTAAGFAHGLRRRSPVRNAQVSRTYRRNFYSFASPWWVSRRPREVLGFVDRDAPPLEQRVTHYFASRSRYYPNSAATLEF
jgi:GT2 family glycosyltransferase